MTTNGHKLSTVCNSLIAILVFFCISIAHTPASGAEDGVSEFIQRFRFGAFGTLGLVYDSSDFHMARDLGQPDTFHGRYSFFADSLIGAQMDFKVMDGLDATVQMVAKERPRQTFEESLEWAFLRWTPNDSFTLRAGRLGMDLYLLSDSRNVSYAYLWQRPVLEFYSLIWIYNIDGADMSYRWKVGDGTLQAKVFGGVMTRSLELVKAKGVNDFEYSMFGGRLSYETESLKISAGYGRTTILNNMQDSLAMMEPLYSAVPIWPQAAGIVGNVASKNKVFNYFSAGASYDDTDWALQGEFGYLESNWSSMPSALFGYLSIGHHFGDFTPYMVLAAVKTVGSTAYTPQPPVTGNSRTDAGLYELYSAASLFTRGLRVDQKTVSLGVRWDFYHNMAMKLQWDLSEVGAGGSSMWWKSGPNPFTEKTYVNLLSGSFNFAF